MEDKATINLSEQRLLITPLEAKKLLGVGTNRIYTLIRTPGFPATRIGNRVYINKAALQKWVDKITDFELED